MRTCDVLVIGGGPAGATVSALLSERGWRVELLDKDCHPRFHIGESLLPASMPILQGLGVLDKVSRIGVVKPGADLTPASGERGNAFEFREVSREWPTAFQVKRAEFDDVLLTNARAKGVDVFEATRARRVETPPGRPVRVSAVGPDGREQWWRAHFLIDASGREALLANRLSMKMRDRRHNSVALFAHFEGVERQPGQAAGNISVYWFDRGWLWVIPLYDGRVSVGVVLWADHLKTSTAGREHFLLDSVEHCPPLAQRLRRAVRVTPVMATGNFSYKARRMFGERYLLVGDAYAFLDPIFSTGVHVAMQSAAFAADAVEACLREPESAARHLSRHAAMVDRGLEELSWFIYRFTSPASQWLYMQRGNPLGMRTAVLSLLAGAAFERTGRRLPVQLFKGAYYATSLAMLPATLTWLRSRSSGHREALRQRRIPPVFPK